MVGGARACAAVLLAWSAVVTRRAAAQADSTHHDGNVWLVYNGQHRWSSRWTLYAEAQLRRADGGAVPKQFVVRPGVRYAWRSNVALTAGYLYQRNTPQGLLADPIATDEHRAWEQVEVQAPAGRFTFSHRARIEHRWQQETADGAGGPRVTGRSYQTRARYQLRASRPLHGGGLNDRGWYATATEEPFFRLGRDAGRTLDQNRAFVGVGFRAHDGLRIEGGYLNQHARPARGRARETSHVLQLSLYSEVPLRGPR